MRCWVGPNRVKGLYKKKYFLIKATPSDWLSFTKTKVFEGLKMTILGISSLGDIISTVEKNNFVKPELLSHEVYFYMC